MPISNYPAAWSRCTAQFRPPDGVVPKELGGDFGQLARWSARFRLAKSFKALDLGDAYANSDTPQMYAAITRIFLVYSAFEIYCHIICLNPSKEDQVKPLQDALSQQKTIKAIRNSDQQYAVAKFLLQHLTSKTLQPMIRDFIAGKEVNVS